MAKARIMDVTMDDTSINVSKEVDLVFSIANSLRGAYKSDKYNFFLEAGTVVPICVRTKDE